MNLTSAIEVLSYRGYIVRSLPTIATETLPDLPGVYVILSSGRASARVLRVSAARNPTLRMDVQSYLQTAAAAKAGPSTVAFLALEQLPWEHPGEHQCRLLNEQRDVTLLLGRLRSEQLLAAVR